MHGHAHQVAGLDELPRDPDIFTRWLDVSRWVVVSENHGGCVCEDCDLEHLARLNDRGGQAADADERQTQNRIRGIQENQDHLLSIFQAEVLLQ